MFDRSPIRKTILLELDVAVADENEDYLEVEITHPRLSGAMYLTVSSRKELEAEMDKIDLTGTEELEKELCAKPYQSVIPMGYVNPAPQTSAQVINKPVLSVQLPVPDSANSVESLIKNTFNIASGLMELRMKLKKK